MLGHHSRTQLRAKFRCLMDGASFEFSLYRPPAISRTFGSVAVAVSGVGIQDRRYTESDFILLTNRSTRRPTLLLTSRPHRSGPSRPNIRVSLVGDYRTLQTPRESNRNSAERSWRSRRRSSRIRTRWKATYSDTSASPNSTMADHGLASKPTTSPTVLTFRKTKQAAGRSRRWDTRRR